MRIARRVKKCLAIFMKAFLIAVCLICFSVCPLRAGDPSFIIITKQTVWQDGLFCALGEVEQVLGETGVSYLISSAKGKQYAVPKTNARIIAAADAVLALLAQREALCAQIEASEPAQPARPTQYNGRPLPPNWIDPKQADANFFAQQQLKQQRALQSELQRTQQDLQKLQQEQQQRQRR